MSNDRFVLWEWDGAERFFGNRRGPAGSGGDQRNSRRTGAKSAGGTGERPLIGLCTGL